MSHFKSLSFLSSGQCFSKSLTFPINPYLSLTCHGYSPISALLPPAILLALSALLGIPQSKTKLYKDLNCTSIKELTAISNSIHRMHWHFFWVSFKTRTRWISAVFELRHGALRVHWGCTPWFASIHCGASVTESVVENKRKDTVTTTSRICCRADDICR